MRCDDGDDDYDEKNRKEFCWENRWTYIDDMSVRTHKKRMEKEFLLFGI